MFFVAMEATTIPRSDQYRRGLLLLRVIYDNCRGFGVVKSLMGF